MATGCSGHDEATRERPPAAAVEPPRPFAAAETAIGGGTAAQRRLLRQILERFRRTGVKRMRIVPAEALFRRSANGTVGMRARYASGDDHAAWESRLIAGVLADESQARRLPAVVAFDIGTSASERVVGSVRVGGPNGPASQNLSAAVRWATGVDGVRIVAFRNGLPGGRAVPTLIVEVDRPAEFLVNRLPYVLPSLRDKPGVGYSLGVRDVAGRRVYSTSAGYDWLSVRPRRDLEGCAPLPRYAPGHGPGRCPYQGPRVGITRRAHPQLTVAEVKAIARRNLAPFDEVSMLLADRGVLRMCRGRRVKCAATGAVGVVWMVSLFRTGDPAGTGWLLVDDATHKVLSRGSD